MYCLRKKVVCAMHLTFLATVNIAFCDDIAPRDGIQQLEEIKLLINEQSRLFVEQTKTLEEQQARFDEYRQNMQLQIESQRRRLEGLHTRINILPHQLSVSQLASTEAKGTDKTGEQNQLSETAKKSQKNLPIKPDNSPATVGIPPAQPKEQKPPEIATIFEQPGVLTPRGKMVFEPSLQYSHSSSNRLSLVGYTIIPAIHIGLIDVRKINRDTFLGSMAARYGLTNRMELEAKVPYVYRMESTSTLEFATAVSKEEEGKNTEGNGIGDVDFGLRYQLNTPTSGPFYIASLKVKSDTGKGPFDLSRDKNEIATEQPTGSGFWALQAGLSTIYPTDPAVFFGGVNYMWNIERHIDRYKYDYDPGDAIGFNFGMGIAMNEKASFSIGYDHSIIGINKIDGQNDKYSMTTHVGTLLFGYSLRLGEKLMVNLSLGIGVTEAAPEMQLTLRVPFNL